MPVTFTCWIMQHTQTLKEWWYMPGWHVQHTHCKHTRRTHPSSHMLLTLELVSLTVMTGWFFLRSHTTHLPLGLAEATMCSTWRFHDTETISSGGWREGGREGGISDLFEKETQTSLTLFLHTDRQTNRQTDTHTHTPVSCCLVTWVCWGC